MTADGFEFDFEVGDYDSDAESVVSHEDELLIDLDDWNSGSNNFDSFEFRYYMLRRGMEERYQDANDLFVDSILTAYRTHDNITAIRLLADIHDLDDEENVRWSQNIRFEISLFENLSELRSVLVEYLSSNTAPVWHRLTTDETSDKAYNKIIRYHYNYFDFCIQREKKSAVQVTTVCGEQEIHPGIFIKLITDHNISYRSNDCLIQCLNEVLNERKDPIEVRTLLRPNGNINRDIHTPRHINSIAKMYDAQLCISDIIERKNYKFNKDGRINVKLVKVGKVIGIFDRHDPTVDKRNTSNSCTFFDLETVGPKQSVYAFTWRSSRGDITACHNDFDYIESLIEQQVFDTLKNVSDNETMTVYSWNGSRFDSWIMFKIIKKRYDKKLWIHDIIINSGNELLSFKITYTESDTVKRHMVFKDAKKMFNVSMPEACTLFNIGAEKHEFSHDEVDEAYMNGTFDNYIKLNRGRIMDYVRQDGVLLEEVTKAIANIYAKENINMYTVLTRSVASSISWQKTIENHKILKEVTCSPYKEICGVKYNDIMDHAVGGRTQCVRRGVFKNVCGVDVNSMYPYVCSHNLYPCGEIIELRHGEHPPKDKLGLYLVRIKRQSYPNVIPYRKNKHYPYDWNSNREFEKWVTNIDMEQLDDYEVLKGFYWSDKTDKFYKAFMIDKYTERCAIPKSDPMNLHIKLEMNGVTGSNFQYSFRELIMVFTKREFELNVKKYSELVKIIGCEPINEEQYIVTMRAIKFNENDPRIKAQREFCKGAITQKPWVLTMFTYSYARKELRDEWIKLERQGCQVLYCDTDSLFFTNPDNVVKREDYRDSKDLGKWTVECWNDEGAFHTPKVYAIKNTGKIRIKGVGYNSLIVDTRYTNKDLGYTNKMNIFIDLNRKRIEQQKKENDDKKKEKIGKPGYSDVKDLIGGKPLKTIGFVMERSKEHGIKKNYTIKIIKAETH